MIATSNISVRPGGAIILLLTVLQTGCASSGGEAFLVPASRVQTLEDANFVRDVANMVALHSPYTGVHVFESPGEALVAFVRLIDGVESTLDLRYPGWRDDEQGRFLLARLWQAAERGVRVRLLINSEDAGTRIGLLSTYDAHPQMEIRLLGPTVNSPVPRPNLRHKILVSDNRIGIVDAAGIEMPSRPMPLTDDVLLIGPLLPVMAKCFFVDWNSDLSVGIASRLGGPKADRPERVVSAAYSEALRDSRIARLTKIDALSFEWGEVRLSSGVPDDAGKGCR